MSLVVMGALVGLGASYLITPKWMALGVLEYKPAGGDASSEAVLKAEANVTSRRSLAALILDPKLNLYATEQAAESLDKVEDEMRSNVRVVVSGRAAPGLFAVSFVYRDKEKALRTAEALMARFRAEMPGDVAVLDAASMPRNPVSPKRPAVASAGAILGA
jgi:hypothetical protein